MRLKRTILKMPIRFRKNIRLHAVWQLRNDSGWRMVYAGAYTGTGRLTQWYLDYAARRGFPTKRADIIGRKSLRTQSSEDVAAGFRRGWRDILEGRTRPISELWEDFD